MNLQSQQSTSSQSNGTSSELLVSSTLEGGNVGSVLGGVWAVGDRWTARSDGNQGLSSVGGGGDVGSGGGGGGEDSDVSELHC